MPIEMDPNIRELCSCLFKRMKTYEILEGYDIFLQIVCANFIILNNARDLQFHDPISHGHKFGWNINDHILVSLHKTANTNYLTSIPQTFSLGLRCFYKEKYKNNLSLAMNVNGEN